MFPFRSDFDPSLYPPDQLVNSQGMPYSRSLLNMSPQERQGNDASVAWIRAAQAAGRNPYAVGSAMPPTQDAAAQDQDYGGGSDPAAPVKATAAVSRNPQTAFDLPALHQLAIKAGFAPDKAPTAAAIMMAESSGNAGAINQDDPGGSFGLSQINAKAWGQDTARSALDPTNAANLMFKISKGGEDFGPWSTFKSGAYKQYLDNKMLPAFGNSRSASQLMPASVEQTGGLPMDDPSATAPNPAALAAAYGGGGLPSNVAATGGLYNAPAAAPGATDPMSQFLELLKAARGSRDWGQILANMSAGFFGGRGPAQSLAGGFGGLAKGMQQGTSDNTDLLKLAMTMGLGQQGHQIQAFTALTNAGVPLSTAAAASGLQLPTDTPGGMAGSDVHGDDFLKTIDPNVSSQVKALAEGRMQFPNGPALKTPYWQNMIRNVAQFDPSFDAVNYNARSKTRADFTSGTSAKNMTAINTAIGHMGTLSDSADQLGNTSYPLVNEATNMYRSATGDPRIVAFNTAKQAVTDELTRVFRGTGGSNADIEGWEKNINAANSPQQLKAAIQQGVNLLGSRISAVGEQYKKGMGTTAQSLDLLNDHAKQTLAKLPGGASIIQEMGGDPSAYQTAADATPTAPTAVGNGVLPSGVLPSGIKYRRIN